MTTSLNMIIPHVPPSENKIRVHRRQGGQVYSKEARDYVTLFSQFVRENYFTEINRFVAEHTETSVYRLQMTFFFPTLINEGWAKNKAKTLYKKFDVGNRRKLIEDCLVGVLGEIDDSLFFELVLIKEMSQTHEGVHICLIRQNPQEYGVPHVTRDQQDRTHRNSAQ
jgi:Holliday junction resolvase RusA-like endonuclease